MPEQQAFDMGLMDKFIPFTNTPTCAPPDIGKPNLVMDYYDGNTVTALWNYAQHFAMSDNSFSTTFGPSTPGALNLVSGQTHGATPAALPGSTANGTVIGDPDPTFDDCSGSTTVAMSGKNIGDLLNANGITWGWFEGGFKPTSTPAARPYVAPRPTTSEACRRRTTARITSRSSTTRRPPTRITCRRRRST
jgi:phospholipase C